MSTAMKIAYHIENGPTQMYAVDADSAVRAHPTEWAFTPWSVEERNDYRLRQYDVDVEAAQREGRPPPPEPVEVLMSPEQQAELDADDKARADALALVQADDEKQRLEREYDDRVTAARELLKTPRIQMTEPAVAVAPRGPVEIPGDWRNLNVQKRRQMAIRLGAPNTVKADEADDVIAKEAERRGEQRKAELAKAANEPAGNFNPPPKPPAAPSSP